MSDIPISIKSRWPEFDEQQIEAAVRVLRSGKPNYWSGNECREFEAEFARYIGVPHAITLANGTVALELALKALGLVPGDEVIVPSSSFFATASSVVACGGVPVFADIDPRAQTVIAETIEAALSPGTRAIIVVHLYGRPCPMDAIMELAVHHKLVVVEDCAQAHGARYRNLPVGSFGDAAAFSFCQDKIMSTGGEGGMLLCRSRSVWAKAWSYKDHGKDPSCIDAVAGAGYRWIHQIAGTNWRMTEFQAAIGRVQLRRLDAWVARRQQIAALLQKQLASIAMLELPDAPPSVGHAWYRFPMRLRIDELHPDWSRDRVVRELMARGVPCGVGVCPELYLERALERFAPVNRLPHASELAKTVLVLNIHHRLTNSEVAAISNLIRNVLSQSSVA